MCVTFGIMTVCSDTCTYIWAKSQQNHPSDNFDTPAKKVRRNDVKLSID